MRHVLAAVGAGFGLFVDWLAARGASNEIKLLVVILARLGSFPVVGLVVVVLIHPDTIMRKRRTGLESSLESSSAERRPGTGDCWKTAAFSPEPLELDRPEPSSRAPLPAQLRASARAIRADRPPVGRWRSGPGRGAVALRAGREIAETVLRFAPARRTADRIAQRRRRRGQPGHGAVRRRGVASIGRTGAIARPPPRPEDRAWQKGGAPGAKLRSLRRRERRRHFGKPVLEWRVACLTAGQALNGLEVRS